jgi:FkbM family methyltransferase
MTTRRVLLTAARRLLHGAGLEVVRYTPRNFAHLSRPPLLRERGVDAVLDVGANEGQYARELRRSGFAGRIVSFEPVADAFARLERAAGDDPLWDCRRVALGDEDGSAEIHVTTNAGKSSSLLELGARHVSAAPAVQVARRETVPTARLDTLAPELLRAGERAFLKLDVQGLELAVLRGAARTLEQVEGVEAELSFVPLYDGQPPLHELVGYLHDAGFDLVALEPSFRDRASNDLLQANGLFRRR